jgi:hypothetical protein
MASGTSKISANLARSRGLGRITGVLAAVGRHTNGLRASSDLLVGTRRASSQRQQTVNKESYL